MKNISTSTIARGNTTALLNIIGYEVTELDGYVRAIHPSEDKPDLLIHIVARKLCKGESTITSVAQTTVHKLVLKAEQHAGELLPCLGFFVSRYSYEDSELCIIPLETWEHHSEQGGVYVKSSGKYYYNYGNAPADTTPCGAIARMEFKAKLLG